MRSHILLALALLPMTVQSEDSQPAGQKLTAGPITIKHITNWTGTERLMVYTHEPVVNSPVICQFTDFYSLSPNSSAVSRSMLLTALTTGRQVTLQVSACENNRPNIAAVTISP